MIKRLVWKYF